MSSASRSLPALLSSGCAAGLAAAPTSPKVPPALPPTPSLLGPRRGLGYGTPGAPSFSTGRTCAMSRLLPLSPASPASPNSHSLQLASGCSSASGPPPDTVQTGAPPAPAIAAGPPTVRVAVRRRDTSAAARRSCSSAAPARASARSPRSAAIVPAWPASCPSRSPSASRSAATSSFSCSMRAVQACRDEGFCGGEAQSLRQQHEVVTARGAIPTTTSQQLKVHACFSLARGRCCVGTSPKHIPAHTFCEYAASVLVARQRAQPLALPPSSMLPRGLSSGGVAAAVAAAWRASSSPCGRAVGWPLTLVSASADAATNAWPQAERKTQPACDFQTAGCRSNEKPSRLGRAPAPYAPPTVPAAWVAPAPAELPAGPQSLHPHCRAQLRRCLCSRYCRCRRLPCSHHCCWRGRQRA